MSDYAIKTLDSDGLPVYFYHLWNGTVVRAWQNPSGWDHELVLDSRFFPDGEWYDEENWPEGLAEIVESEREAVDTSEPDVWGMA